MLPQQFLQSCRMQVAFVQEHNLHELGAVASVVAQSRWDAERIDSAQIELAGLSCKSRIQPVIVLGPESGPQLADAGNIEGNRIARVPFDLDVRLDIAHQLE